MKAYGILIFVFSFISNSEAQDFSLVSVSSENGTHYILCEGEKHIDTVLISGPHSNLQDYEVYDRSNIRFIYTLNDLTFYIESQKIGDSWKLKFRDIINHTAKAYAKYPKSNFEINGSELSYSQQGKVKSITIQEIKKRKRIRREKDRFEYKKYIKDIEE